jgi:hypothetical protein
MSKMKLYAMSLMAIYEDEAGNSVVMHLPALLPAYTKEDAVASARIHALTKWPPNYGWHSHQAAVIPVTKAFYEATMRADRAGIVDWETPDEPGESFSLALEDIDTGGKKKTENDDWPGLIM